MNKTQKIASAPKKRGRPKSSGAAMKSGGPSEILEREVEELNEFFENNEKVLGALLEAQEGQMVIMTGTSDGTQVFRCAKKTFHHLGLLEEIRYSETADDPIGKMTLKFAVRRARVAERADDGRRVK